ncbi:MAG: hypothetical protein R3B54_14275 [Bdellovibrionota bacterium]
MQFVLRSLVVLILSFTLSGCLFRGTQGNATGYGGGDPRRAEAAQFLRQIRDAALVLVGPNDVPDLCRMPRFLPLDVTPSELAALDQSDSRLIEFCRVYLRTAASNIVANIDPDPYTRVAFQTATLTDEQGNPVPAVAQKKNDGIIILNTSEYQASSPMHRRAIIGHEVLHIAPGLSDECFGLGNPDSSGGRL